MDLTGRQVKRADEYGGPIIDYTVQLPSGRRATITISGPQKKFGGTTLEPSTVNWSAIGSVGAEDAAVYGQALTTAAFLADELHGPMPTPEGV